MATQDPPGNHGDQLGRPPTPTILQCGHGIIGRCRAHALARKSARLISPRNRRRIARWLRRTATHAQEPHPLARHRETLLHYRVAAVRTDLLEIAAMLECAHDPDPAGVAALHDLLADGCDSPLYNSDIHVSELHTTLHYVRAGLTPMGPRDASRPTGADQS
jgi:hypothetical protein